MKRIIVCWEDSKRPREARHQALVECAAPDMLALPVHGLGILVAGPDARVRSPNPFPLFGRKPVALVNLWVDDDDTTHQALAIVRSQGFDAHAYAVDESVYRTYGDNEHAAPRDWPDGTKSPGVTAVTWLLRPARFSPEAWVQKWFSTISPVSEAIQPRTRYVRNVVQHGISEGAPTFDGIVEEAFATPEHITNPYLFYGADTPWSLLKNAGTILTTVMGFTRVWTITTVVMSEWFLRTPPAPDGPPPS